MSRTLLLGVLAFSAFHCYGALQLQMPETAELQHEDDLQTQVKELQKNVSDIWTYITDLRNAVSGHLTHLRQHQEELETTMHKMEHIHESDLHSSGHHHSGEDHSHGDDHSHGSDHSHGDDHSHGSDHSHGDDHSHGSDHSHGDDHSHGSDHGHGSTQDHSHSGEHHSHSGEHGHHSHSHSHSSHDDSHSHGGDDHHHHHDHKDSHETEDLSQQTQKVSETGQVPVAEPVVVPTNRQEHHHHSHSHSESSNSNNVDTMNLMNFHHHHHHSETGSSSRNRTVELPRLSDYGQYDIAVCRMQPNKALSDDQRQEITGAVTLWQKKTGGPLNIHISVRGFDVGDHHGHHQSVQTEQDNETPQAVGHRHGFHVHSSGDLSNGCQTTGPHYNPKGVNHGGPHSLARHVGDLGNIECDEHGVTNIMFSDDIASLRGQYSVFGKSLVIHALEDDLGQGNDAESLKTGNAGTRLACCVIQKTDKIPFRNYSGMKLATQHQNR